MKDRQAQAGTVRQAQTQQHRHRHSNIGTGTARQAQRGRRTDHQREIRHALRQPDTQTRHAATAQCASTYAPPWLLPYTQNRATCAILSLTEPPGFHTEAPHRGKPSRAAGSRTSGVRAGCGSGWCGAAGGQYRPARPPRAARAAGSPHPSPHTDSVRHLVGWLI